LSTTSAPPTTRLPIRAAILWGFAALLLALLFTAATFRSISPSSDLWDYSQEARQLARGEGFTSLYTYPSHLTPPERPPFPVRWRMPLYAVRGAMVLKMGLSLPLGYLLAVAQTHAMLVALVFLLGAHLASPRAGAIAAATAMACPLLLDSFSPGMAQVPAAAMSALVWLLLLRWRGTGTAALAAVVAAAAWHLRAETVLMAPLWILAAGRGRAQRGALFGAGYLLLCVPWLVYIARATGSANPVAFPWTLLYTPEYPGYASVRTYGLALPGGLAYVFSHPGTFAVRWVKDVLGFGLDLLGGLGPIAVSLGIAGLLLRDPRDRYATFRTTLLFAVAIVVQVAAFSALQRSPRFLVPVVPLACVIIGVAAAPVLDRVSGRRAQGAVIALLIALGALTIAFQTREAPRRFPPLPRETATALNTAIAAGAWPRDQLILSDVPDWVAWHADRPALLLPLSRDLASVERDQPVAAIFLSPCARDRNASDGDTAWVGFLDRCEPPPGFSGPASLPGGARLYVRRAHP
jgi:hypothetical protein